jgi:DNA (cytosine-5)-methyltransferase 1
MDTRSKESGTMTPPVRQYPQQRPIAIDFFCGAGGMSLGFEQAGFDVVLGVDVDGHHIATHERNFPRGKVLCSSVISLDATQIRQVIQTDQDIDLVCGGPPCQGFSNMGLRDLKDPRNSLIDHYVRLVLELRPKTFVMENVPGMLAGGTRRILDNVVRLAQEHGYNVTLPVKILDAANFGVPQQRRRVFVLGVRDDVGPAVAYPSGTRPGQPLRPTVHDAIADLPLVDNEDQLFSDNQTGYLQSPSSHYANIARGLIADESDLSIPRIWNRDVCTGCLRTRHAPSSVALYAATPPGEAVPGHKLPRLDPAGICPTLRAGSDSTHGSYTAPRPIHPVYPRCITSREAARLHGYPDWFAFYPLKWHAYRQIGNSVCPPVARAIGYELREAIGGGKSRRVPKSIVLHNNFVLPANRPRTLKRIPQIEQFPPVVAWLFARAFDPKRRVVGRARFTFSDVQEAIRATGVNLTWARPDTFLAEIARSRRVEEILAAPIAKGFTILAVDGACDETIGEFVSITTQGTLEKKDSLQVRIDELHTATQLPLKPFDLGRAVEGAATFLSHATVQKKLWGESQCLVQRVNSGPEDPGVLAFTVLKRGCKKPRNVLVVTCKTSTLPNKQRLFRIGKKHKCQQIVVLAVATNRHLVVIGFRNCENSPREYARQTFEAIGSRRRAAVKKTQATRRAAV